MGPPTSSCCSRRSKAGALVKVTDRHTAIDYAHVLKDLADIAVSREDPKFLRVDDAEIVGDGRRELVEPLWHGFAQEAEHGFGKVAEFGVAFVVGDVLVHHFPQPFDRVEMRAV